MRDVDTGRFFELLAELEAPTDAERLFDQADPAGALRLRNLHRYLELMAAAGPQVMLVAEAPGWRGTSVTGIPFMSVREVLLRPGMISGAPGGDGFELPPDPVALWEASSAAVWAALATWNGPLPLSWPIYPNHPIVASDRLTNRTPRPSEVKAGVPIALELARSFGITQVVAVGRKAQGALAANGVDAAAVRHPAQGGAKIFALQLAALNG